MQETAGRLLTAFHAHPKVAGDVSRALSETSLAGIDSHGFVLLPRILKRVSAGRAQVTTPATVTRQQGAVGLLDAALCPGQHAATAAVDLAIELSQANGLGYVAVNQSTHFGGCYPYLTRATDAGKVAVVGSNSLRSMAAFGARQANLGNNPFGFAAPVAGGSPVLFDFSCGVMSFGARNALLKAGEPVPGDAFITPDQPDLDDGVYEIAGNLAQVALPFGGHKGAAVAVMVEVLAAVLAGGAFGKDTETLRDERFLGPSHFALVFDPGALGGHSEVFQQAMAGYLAGIRDAVGEVRIPGDRAGASRTRREREGVEMPSGLLEELESWSKTLKAPLPPLDGRA